MSRLLVAIALLCLARPAHGQDEPDEEERKLAPPRVFGYIQTHYRYAFHTGEDPLVDHDDFRVQRVRIGLEGHATPWLSYQVEIDPRAPEITGVLRDAYVALAVIPRHRIRIGQQKTQFGHENRESSSRLFAVNRTEVSDNLSRGRNLRDIGIGLLGNVKLGGGFRIEDAITVVNGAGMNVQADDTRMKNVWGRLGLRYKNDDLGELVVRIGVSGGIGDMLDPGDDPVDPADDLRLELERLGADVELDHRWFFVAAEWVAGRDRDAATGERDEISGYYVSAVGKTPWRVGPIARLDTLGDEFRRWTFGAYYGLPDARFRLMINFELRELKDGVRGDDKLYVWAQARF